MAEKILNTRIQLKYDSLQNWALHNPVLKAGEVAIAYLPPKGEGVAPAAVSEAVLMKVGPGLFKDLPWVSALAADVYAWAKQSEEDFLAWIEEKRPTVVDTDLDTRYGFELVDGALKVTKTLYTLGVAGTTEEVGTYDFLNSDELNAILANYYNKEEVVALIEGAKKYADDNDANTTYTIGYESKVEGEGGHPARIVLTPSEGAATYVDATPFIKDGMVENVTYDDATDTLTFVFNTDAGKQNIDVKLTDILAPYTGNVGDTITVVVDGNVIKAELNDSVKTDISTATSDAAQAKSDAAAAVSTANDASTVAGEAKTAAEGAVAVANEAKEAATGAVNSAKSYAEAAKASATTAGEQAGAAANSAREAGNAQTAAEAAQGAAEGARDAAVSAKEAAVSAQGAAETAQGKAEDAQKAAEDAKAAAEASNTSATAIANEAKGIAEGAKTASDAATEAVAGLATIAKTGNVNDLVQTTGDVLVFYCGDASTVI